MSVSLGILQNRLDRLVESIWPRVPTRMPLRSRFARSRPLSPRKGTVFRCARRVLQRFQGEERGFLTADRGDWIQLLLRVPVEDFLEVCVVFGECLAAGGGCLDPGSWFLVVELFCDFEVIGVFELSEVGCEVASGEAEGFLDEAVGYPVCIRLGDEHRHDPEPSWLVDRFVEVDRRLGHATPLLRSQAAPANTTTNIATAVTA